VSLSFTLSRNEKVEQYIKRRPANLMSLDFGLKVLSFPCKDWLWSHSCLSLRCFLLEFSQQVVSEPLVYSLGEYNLILYWNRSLL